MACVGSLHEHGLRGTSPDYPDFRHGSTAGPAGPPPEHTERDIDRIAAERRREDEVLRSHTRAPVPVVAPVPRHR